MGYLGATLTQVFTRAGGADVSIRDVTIAQIRNGARDCGWRRAPEARGGICEFWKSQLVEFCLGRRRLAFVCSPKPGQWPCGRRYTCCGGRWKSQNRKNVYLAPYVEEPLNSKVIKSFVPELRTRKCFSCFEIPMFYVYIYIYMNILCTFHVSVSWVWCIISTYYYCLTLLRCFHTSVSWCFLTGG